MKCATSNLMDFAHVEIKLEKILKEKKMYFASITEKKLKGTTLYLHKEWEDKLKSQERTHCNSKTKTRKGKCSISFSLCNEKGKTKESKSFYEHHKPNNSYERTKCKTWKYPNPKK